MAEPFTIGGITLLALADSVNPCAIAVLAMVLVAILIQNPEKKRKVLFAGLGFVLAVYIAYLFYGVILIQVWNSLTIFLREISGIIYKLLAVIAMVIGALNIKDFFYYKKGGIATEMPIFLRPKVKRIIEKITSPKGAFTIGFFVSIFLLPCTIGPYVVASGLLSEYGTLGALPWLLYYNLLFVIPMLVITLLIYFGLSRIQDIEGWKDKNIKRLHLIAGILLFLVGVALLLGWI